MSPTVIAIVTGILSNLPALIGEVQAAGKDVQNAADTTAKVKAILNDAGAFMQTLARAL